MNGRTYFEIDKLDYQLIRDSDDWTLPKKYILKIDLCLLDEDKQKIKNSNFQFYTFIKSGEFDNIRNKLRAAEINYFDINENGITFNDIFNFKLPNYQMIQICVA
jgi:hypothetical protein